MRKEEIEEKITHIKTSCNPDNQSRREWAETYLQLSLGDPEAFKCIFNGFEEEPMELLVINHIEAKCDTLAGELKNRQNALIAVPSRPEYTKFANQITKCFNWFTLQTERYTTLSQAFKTETTINGCGVIRYQRSFVDDIITGNPFLKKYTFKEIDFDTTFKNIDLSDCKYFSFLGKFTKKSILKMLKNKVQFDEVFYKMDDYSLANCEEIYYLDFRKAKILYNISTQIQQELLKKDEYKIPIMMSQQPDLRVEETEIPTVRLCIKVQDEVVYDGDNELGIDRYPLAAFLGDWNPAASIRYRFKGIPEKLRTSQFFRSYIQTVQAKNLRDFLNPGFIYPTDVPADQKDIYNPFKRRCIPINAGEDPNKIVKIRPDSIDASSILFSNQAVQEMDIVSGISPAASGTDGGDVAGVTTRARMRLSFNNYSHWYENYAIADRILGKIFVEDIIKNYSKQKLQMILREEPAPEFFTCIKQCFNIIHGNGEDTIEQKEQKRYDLGTLKTTFGIDIPPDIILGTYSLQDSDKIIEYNVKKAEEAQQLAKAQAEDARKNQEAERKVLEGTALSQVGSALERSTKAASNRASIESEEIERVERLAKALKDIDSIDVDKLNFYINTINQLNTPQSQELPIEEEVVSGQIEDMSNEDQGMREQQIQQL